MSDEALRRQPGRVRRARRDVLIKASCVLCVFGDDEEHAKSEAVFLTRSAKCWGIKLLQLRLAFRGKRVITALKSLKLHQVRLAHSSLNIKV